jgi:hypothetical protein
MRSRVDGPEEVLEDVEGESNAEQGPEDMAMSVRLMIGE